MTVVKIKRVNGKTSVPENVLKKAVRIAIEKYGPPQYIRAEYEPSPSYQPKLRKASLK